MKALLIIAHGSRNPQSSEETGQLVNSLRDQPHPFDIITHAFLELAEPDVSSAINDLVARGADEIAVLPLFLARGNHVALDIPELIDQARNSHRNVSITLTRHIGAASTLPGCILRHLEES
jgi:sirohydrochlorin ferrochelatase